MKKTFYISIYMFLSVCGLSCSNNDIQDYQSVYITAAERVVTTTLSASDNGGELSISVSSSQLAERDIQVEIDTDISLIQAYNERTGNNYSPLPAGSFELESSTLTIMRGTTISSGVNFRVLSVADFRDGESYLMPITITRANGISILEASQTIYVVVNRVIISTVASLTNNFFRVDFSSSNLNALRAITMETRVMVNNFQTLSPFISSIIGIEETFLMRFGDVSVGNNQLQIAGGVTATNVGMTFSPNVWYHVAVVYNGSSLFVYVDGRLVAQSNNVVRTIDLTNDWMGGFHIGFSERGRLLDGYISESKLWSRALAQSELVNGACGIDPSSEGLIAYWKFNEGSGNIANDLSGNGYNAIANRAVTWLPDVRCN